MIALYIICGVLLLLGMILLIRVKAGISLCNDVVLTVKLLFITLSFKLDKDSRLQFEKKDKKEKKQKQKKPSKSDDIVPTEKAELPVVLGRLKAIVAKILNKFGRYVCIERFIIKLRVASDDPAKTAVLYGGASAFVSSLFALVMAHKNRTSDTKKLFFELTPDFISEKPDYFIDIMLSLRVWHILSTGLTAWKIKKIQRKDA